MKRGYRMLRGAIFTNPLALHLMGEKMQRIANKYLPFSIGIEVECKWKDGNESRLEMEDKCRKDIPGLMDVEHDSSEKRFRISAGWKGLVQLYQITEFLKETCCFNPESGIHYHIDMTYRGRCKFFHYFDEYEPKFQWIITELEKWNYQGSYNAKGVEENNKGYWVNFSKMGTMEVRIGEMSFDYNHILRRIIHCCHLAERAGRIFEQIGKKAEEEEKKIDEAQMMRLMEQVERHKMMLYNNSNGYEMGEIIDHYAGFYGRMHREYGGIIPRPPDSGMNSISQRR